MIATPVRTSRPRITRSQRVNRTRRQAAGLASCDARTYHRSAGTMASLARIAGTQVSPQLTIELMALASPRDRQGKGVRAILAAASTDCPKTVATAVSLLQRKPAVPEPAALAIIDFLGRSGQSAARDMLEELIREGTWNLDATGLAVRALQSHAVAAPRPAPLLISVAGDKEAPRPLRRRALEILAVLRDPRQLNPLSRLLAAEEEPGLLRCLTRALAALGCREALEALGQASLQGPPHRRVEASRALAAMPLPEVSPWLRQLLHSPVATIRHEARRALLRQNTTA